MNHEDRKHFLKNLKVGEKVFRSSNYDKPCGAIQTIARITKTMFITECKNRYKRETGYVVGGGGFTTYHIEGYPTCKVIEKLTRHNLIKKLSQCKYANISTEILQKISDIMESEN